VLMLARYAGLRGQTIVVVNWKKYQPHPLTGMCIRNLDSQKNTKRTSSRYCPSFKSTLPASRSAPRTAR
jgi:hypothetical protein